MSHQYEDLPQYGDDETDYAALEEYRSNVVQMPQPGAPAMTPEQIRPHLMPCLTVVRAFHFHSPHRRTSGQSMARMPQSCAGSRIPKV
jgi:hypothetical protein